MNIDSSLSKAIRTLSAKNSNSLPFEWFIAGFLFNSSDNTKSVEEIFGNIANITMLARNGALSEEETDDILLRMMKKSANTEKNKIAPKGSPGNFLNVASKESTQYTDVSNPNSAVKPKKNGESNPILRKSSTIEFSASDKNELLDDNLSYTSEKEGQARNGKQSNNKDLNDFDVEELSADGNPRREEFVRKPINQVDVSDLREKKNLKREAEPADDEATMELIRKFQEEDEMLQRRLKEQKKNEENDLNEALIRKLQEEDDAMHKNLEDRKKKEEKESAEVDCSICLDSLMEEAFLPLSSCEHIFHEKCLEEYLKAEVDSRNIPIRCPVNCGNEMQEMDIKHVLDKDDFKKFSEYSLQKYISTHADEISCCPTPNCNYAFAQDEKEDNKDQDTEFKCPICKKKYCLNCRVDFHKGQSCKEYQISNKRDANDIKFEKFIKGKKFKQCAKCKFWVEKNQGCDHMTCRCKYEFCYKCGGKYRECECVKKLQEIAQRRLQRQQNRGNKRRKR